MYNLSGERILKIDETLIFYLLDIILLNVNS
jgi:hypothetical protein